MKSIKRKVTVLFILFSFLAISGSSTTSEEEYNTLESFLDEYGFVTFDSGNPHNEEGEHPLQLAVDIRNYEVAQLLINEGVNTDIMYALGKDRTGLFECGMTAEDVEELSKLYGEVEIIEVDLMAEGMSTPAIELTFEDEISKALALQLSEMDRTICRIEIYSDIFVTEEGIGIGSTYDDLENNYLFERVFWGDAGQPVVIVEALDMSFVLEQGDWWQMGEVVGEIPGDTRIVNIFGW
ncbi:MAG: hypothetical protein GQ565_10725 [Candidatus Aegiribacteria sp.]|nr:hypothetical protein [Candidatus Aegiribacteria sp.]